MEYNWIISQLDCKPEIDGMQNYVVAVHWRYVATQDEYSCDVYGVQSFEVNEGANFIPYEDLTKAIIVGWLESTLDVVAMQDSLANQIADLINPPIIHPPLPFEN